MFKINKFELLTVLFLGKATQLTVNSEIFLVLKLLL